MFCWQERISEEEEKKSCKNHFPSNNQTHPFNKKFSITVRTSNGPAFSLHTPAPYNTVPACGRGNPDIVPMPLGLSRRLGLFASENLPTLILNM